MSSAECSTLYRSCSLGLSEPPCPNKSTVTSVYSCCASLAKYDQVDMFPVNPCRATIGGPEPATLMLRLTPLTNTHVCSRVVSAASAAADDMPRWNSTFRSRSPGTSRIVVLELLRLFEIEVRNSCQDVILEYARLYRRAADSKVRPCGVAKYFSKVCGYF